MYLNDKELVVKYRAKQDAATFNVLYSQYTKLIDKYAYYYLRMSNSYITLEDLKQQGALGLLKAIETYNISMQKSLFYYHAKIWIRSFMLQYIKQANLCNRVDLGLDTQIRKRKPRQTKNIEIRHNSSLEIETNIITNNLLEEFRKYLPEFKQSLNELELYILENRILSDSPMLLREIGKEFGMTRQNVNLHEKQLKELFIEYYRLRLKVK